MQIFLTTPESKLRVKNGLFEVSYYDKDGNLQHVQHAPALLDSIWLHDGATVTVAAIRLGIQNNVDLVVCDRYGMPEGRILGFRPTTTSLVQKAQALVSVTAQGLEYARGWAVRKLAAQAEYLERLGRRRTEAHRAQLADPIRLINEALGHMQALAITAPCGPDAAEVSARIRGYEGVASKAFFDALSRLVPEQYAFDGRSRRPAKNPFNAFLNYAFAVLYRKVDRALLAAGLNPYIGFLHRDGYQFKSLVYDFVELFRTDMVRVVFTLFAKQSVKPTIHTTGDVDGGIRLTREGKALLLKKINRFFEKKTESDGLSMSRDRALEKEAQRFALSLLALVKHEREMDEETPEPDTVPFS
ncbi:MAG: CRISPR-associated endonuclease Cas1 [Saprospirales bacterium]|nr:CRISPR-associated endonuclease Cas1 [Saprospirales bacterium]